MICRSVAQTLTKADEDLELLIAENEVGTLSYSTNTLAYFIRRELFKLVHTV